MNQKSFFARHALTILMIVFFLVPFTLRGARYALQRMKNDVKDWLPAHFDETRELTWFGEHFLGERFIVVTWPGCTEDSEEYQLLVRKLRAEIAPKKPTPTQATSAANATDQVAHASPANSNAEPTVPLPDAPLETRLDVVSKATAVVPKLQATPQSPEDIAARLIGDKHGLHIAGGIGEVEFHDNWGGRGERWVKGNKDQWYFITPDGELFKWEGQSNLVGYLKRAFQRNAMGKISAEGEFVTKLKVASTANGLNPYFEDPRKITARYFSSVTTGPDVLEELSAPGGALWPYDPNLSDEEKSEVARTAAMERLQGNLFGPDQKQTCIVLTLSDEGKIDLSRVIGRDMLGKPPGKIYRLACGECGISEADLKLGGPPVDNVAIDEEGTITLVRLVGFSVGLGVLLSYLSFRSVKVTAMVFFVGGVAAVTSLSIVFFSDSSVDAVLMSMPSLVYVLGLSGAVHIINYYRDACIEDGVEGAAEKALGHGWWPCTLAAFTTALGLLSLYTSDILPIKKFGLFSALGVMATLILLFTYLPSALTIWAPGYERLKHQRKSGMLDAMERFWSKIGEFVIRRHAMVAIVCIIALCVFLGGIPRIQTSVQLLKLFDGNSKIIKDYEWLEAKLGKLVPMELVVRISPNRILAASEVRARRKESADKYLNEIEQEKFQLSFLERMELTGRIQQVVEEEFGEQGSSTVGRGLSAATFAPEIPPPGGSFLSSQANMRRTLAGVLESRRDDILAADYLRIDRDKEFAGSELWRISLRLGALNDVNYGNFVHELKNVVEPVLAAYQDRDLILKEIDRRRAGAGFHKSSVLFIGYNPYKKNAATTDAATTDAATTDAATTGAATTDAGAAELAEPATATAAAAATAAAVAEKTAKHKINQTQIDADSINYTLACAGLSDKYRPRWCGPDNEHCQPGNEEWWENILKSVDCVVLVGDVPNYDETFWQFNSKSLIDVRETHRFVQSGDRPSETAAQQEHAIQVVYTGVVPVVYKAQNELLASLIESIFLAFVMIMVVMMFLLRKGKISPTNLINVRGGLLSMAPNVFPVIVIFGAMGYMNIKVDIGSMMTASVAMGVAVDDTIHFLNWFRSGMVSGLDRKQAIGLAYRRVATAMTQTTLIGGLGLSVFAFSTFTPTQRFGVLMLTLLAMALIGDLIFLPALLAGPLGKFFEPKTDPELNQLETAPQIEDQDAGGDGTENENSGSDNPANEDGGQRRTAVPDSSQPHTGQIELHGKKIRRDTRH
ncbi:MAG: putative RND superfamily exporter protein [Pirellulaceae bacterium]|jgi:predicted RND superfamily exporter protein